MNCMKKINYNNSNFGYLYCSCGKIAYWLDTSILKCKRICKSTVDTKKLISEFKMKGGRKCT